MATRPVVRPPVPLSLCAALLASGVLSAPALPAPAPATPSYALSWGTSGSAPGLLEAPSAVAADPSGNVYVVDTGNHRIEKFDREGHLLIRWGSLGSGGGQFNGPSGIALGAGGSVLVVDPGNSRVKEYDATGALMHQWGSPGTGNGQFSTPSGVATDAAGNFYVSDAGDRIQKFAPDGSFLLQWGSPGAAAGEFDSPGGIAVDARGNVYVADRLNHRIQKFGSTGEYVTEWGSFGAGPGEFDLPVGVGVDALGNVCVVEQGNARVQKFTGDGTWVTAWGSPGSGAGAFAQPSGLAVDAAGNVYVADRDNDRIQKFSGAGAFFAPAAPTFRSNIGSSGSADGQLNAPYAVATDAAGWIYVADHFNSRVQKFSGNGVFYLKFGSAGSGPGQFIGLNGIAVDGSGNIYVTSGNRVQKFDPTGGFLLQWGTAGAGVGQFSSPVGIAVDGFGDVYVSDTGNDRVQKFTSAGAYVTQWGSLGSGSGQFDAPRGIGADRAGNVYVVDSNARVQRFTSTGTFVMEWLPIVPPSSSTWNLGVDVLGDVYVCHGGPSSSVQKFRGDGTPLVQWGSYGAGNGQFAPAYGVAPDATGNVYVADYGGNRIVKFMAPPSILFVSDVGNDQGRQARLRIRGSSIDSPVNGGVTGYAVYRAVESLPASTSDVLALADWDYLGTQPAAGDPEYSMVVPTLADATSTSAYYSAFLVRALTPDPITHFDSISEAGYSIDNLSPPAPAPFTAVFTPSATQLHWGVSSVTDFAQFRLYRGASADFVPGAGNLVVATTDTGYVDVGFPDSDYKISAVDWNGNESAYAAVGPSPTVDVPEGPRPVFALDGVRPNPSTGRALVVRFTLPSASPARLELIDVAGRRRIVRDVGALGAGAHGIDLAGGGAISPGVYFVRLVQGSNGRMTRITVLD